MHGPTIDVIAVEQLAKLIHKSPASIRSDASRHPAALPPICRLPGSKRLLWLLDDVRAWMSDHVDRLDASTLKRIEVEGPVARKRGRPRKTTAKVPS